MSVINDCLQSLDRAEAARNDGKKFNYDNNTVLDKAHKIFKDNEFTKEDTRFICYAKMIKKLDAIEELACESGVGDETKNELFKLGPLLRKAWRMYEADLRVHEYENLEEPYCDEIYGVYGVHINLEYSMREDLNWIVAYHYIFHEFFHNIYGIFLKKPTEYENDCRIANMIAFGKVVETDVDNLVAEEKKNDNEVVKKRLKDLTYYKNKKDNEKQKKYRAALFDIIGAVLYRGKYGCYPPNSQFYTDDGKKCLDMTCDFKNNSWIKCDCRHGNLCGHLLNRKGEKFWGNRSPTKDIKDSAHQDFLMLLAAETFAHLSAEAIINPKAYEKIMECLPKSYRIFRENLKNISLPRYSCIML